MNILVCFYPFPFYRTHGQALRVYNVFKNIAKKHNVFLLGISDNILNLKDNFLLFDIKDVFAKIFTIEIKRKRFMEILNLLTPKYINLEFPLTKIKLYKLISQIIRKQKIDIIYVNGFPFVDLLLADFKEIPKVLDLCDSRHLIHKRAVENTSQALNKFVFFFNYLRTKNIEKYLIKKYDAITFISHIDASFSAKLARGFFEVIPNGIDTEYFKPISSIKEESPSVIFFGTMSFKPNIDAVLYFYKEIFPKIRRVFPNIHFYVVGTSPVNEIIRLREDNNVIVTGAVDDVRPFIMKANVVVVPMRMGSGMKNKILEAMALQKPVVCTSLAIEALDNKCKNVVFIGNTPEEFADKTIMLLKNERERKEVGFKARKVVEEVYSWKRCAKKYCKLFETLLIKGKIEN